MRAPTMAVISSVVGDYRAGPNPMAKLLAAIVNLHPPRTHLRRAGAAVRATRPLPAIPGFR